MYLSHRYFSTLCLVIVVSVGISEGSRGGHHRHHDRGSLLNTERGHRYKDYVKSLVKILFGFSELFPEVHSARSNLRDSRREISKTWETAFITLLRDLKDIAYKFEDVRSAHGRGKRHSLLGSSSSSSSASGSSSSSEEKGLLHSHRHHSSKDPSVFDILATLFKHNVKNFPVKGHAPTPTLLKRIINLFTPAWAGEGHHLLPNFSMILEHIIKTVSSLLKMDTFSHLLEPFNPLALFRLKRESSSPVAQLLKIIFTDNPALKPESYLEVGMEFMDSALFKGLETAYEAITGKELDLLEPGMKIFEKFNKLTEFLEDRVFPALDGLSQLLALKVDHDWIFNSWKLPFKILNFK